MTPHVRLQLLDPGALLHELRLVKAMLGPPFRNQAAFLCLTEEGLLFTAHQMNEARRKKALIIARLSLRRKQQCVVIHRGELWQHHRGFWDEMLDCAAQVGLNLEEATK